MLPKDLTRWRKAERERLIAERKAMASSERERATVAIAANLSAILPEQPAEVIAIYWPLFGEIDLRSWAKQLIEQHGASIALPVVAEKDAPLEFWRWRPGDAMVKGFWNIPVPARRELVSPGILTAPLVGFDAAGFRLGYGGGYFDRTLASLSPRPLVIGIGLAFQRMDSIRPEPHDIPMDLIVTETGTLRR